MWQDHRSEKIRFEFKFGAAYRIRRKEMRSLWIWRLLKEQLRNGSLNYSPYFGDIMTITAVGRI